jgi:hypothetical protein
MRCNKNRYSMEVFYFLWKPVFRYLYLRFVYANLRDSVVGTSGWTVRGSNLRRREFSVRLQTGPGAHAASCTMGTGSTSGVKRPKRVADHPPSSSGEVTNGLQLYPRLKSVSAQACHRLTITCRWIWHSEDRASWYILIIKPTRCTNFSNSFLE